GLVDRLVERGSTAIWRQKDVDSFILDTDVQACIQQVAHFGRSINSVPDAFQLLGIGVRQPGLITTTVDSTIGRRIGLHVDSWDKLHPVDTARARNRLNI